MNWKERNSNFILMILFQITPISSLDCDKKVVWYVYHVYYRVKLHCFSVRRSRGWILVEKRRPRHRGLFFHRHIHNGMQPEDSWSGICFTSWIILERFLEFYGHYCCVVCPHIFLPYVGVSKILLYLLVRASFHAYI